MECFPNKTVSIIIVTAGAKDYLWLLLDSVRKQTYPCFEIIVIDNSLNPRLKQEINKGYPEVKLYSNSENLFYCQALNQGIDISSGDFILCLNDDVVLSREFIKEALGAFNINQNIGMVSGKILRRDAKIIDSTGLFLSPWRTARERGYGSSDKGQYQKEEYIFAVNGAVAFYRRKMLEAVKIGGDYFDGDYRIFYEDLDIAWRAQNLGWKGYYTPWAIAYHARGATVRSEGGGDKPFARRYLNDNLHCGLIRNRYLTFIKNESCLDFLLHLPFIFFYDLAVWCYILFFKPCIIKMSVINFDYLKRAFNKRRLIRKKKELKGGF